MKLAMLLPYSNRFSEAVDRVVQLEKAGLDLIYVPEAYAADAVSAMGYLAKTDTVQIGSGILRFIVNANSISNDRCRNG